VSVPDSHVNEDLWVFGYGSLMWRPGFAYAERSDAVIHGLHRALCVRSFVHRGTRAHPGLVLGLDLGGACRGVAFRVPTQDRAQTIAYLREREQVTSVYIEIWPNTRLSDGRLVRALAYRADRTHEQYCPPLPREELFEIVRTSIGASGANPDYVLATQDHLEELGIHDPVLTWLAQALRTLK